MNIVKRIGTKNPAIAYIDRPTVKVLIQKGTAILILNDGLLPGGGVDDNENDAQAIEREVAEEIGATVANIRSIGEVIQYRDFLERRYVIRGYYCEIVAFNKEVMPQNEGERNFTYQWLSKQAALKLVEASIQRYTDVEIVDGSQQGKLFNLETTRAFLLALG